jgi:polyisoprenoid-binding protein YceI
MSTATATLFDTGVWRVDPARSAIGFSVPHWGIATVEGRFHAFSGRLERTDCGVRVHGRVSVRSLETGSAARDRILRDELFNAGRWPAIEFSGYTAAPAAGQEWLLVGTLTIHGVARPVVLRGTPEPLADGAVRIVFEAEIPRSELGISLSLAGALLVADAVQVSCDVLLQRDPH